MSDKKRDLKDEELENINGGVNITSTIYNGSNELSNNQTHSEMLKGSAFGSLQALDQALAKQSNGTFLKGSNIWANSNAAQNSEVLKGQNVDSVFGDNKGNSWVK